MTDRPAPERYRLARDLAAVVLGLAGVTAMLWAAALIDWRLLLGLCGLFAALAAVVLAQGTET